MNASATRELFDRVMVPNYIPSNIIPVYGKGSRLWDQADNEYIDFAGGIAVNCLGHGHPDVIHALKVQAEKIWHVSNVMTNELAVGLAQTLCEKTFAEKVFFANSGAEANEAALKLARKYTSNQGHADKREIISFMQSFHGRTLFTVSVGGQPKYTHGFEPLPAGIVHVPFNDLNALAAVISQKTCAVILEPIQAEGGIIPAEPKFIEGVRMLCDQNNALLIFDEIQTGVGRTGFLYAYMESGIVPDILTTAKALGGGFPISAMLTISKIAQSLGYGTHASTFGGNALACAVANTVVNIVDDPMVLKGVRDKHESLVTGIEELNQKYNLFSDIRGKGLLIGCELNDDFSGKSRDFVKTCEDQKLLVLVAGPDVVRLTPSLIITDEDINKGLICFDAAMKHFKNEHAANPC
jgi:acetylornithine/N-succinyldiaminopimelate aminotransferase